MSIYDYCELVGFYVSEGSTSSEKRKNRKNELTTVHIHQSNSSKDKKQIKNLFKRAFKKHYTDENKVSSYNPSIAKHLKNNYGGHSYTKKLSPFVKNLSTECLEIIIDAMIKGDGNQRSYNNSNYFSYFTSSIQLANDFAEISYKCGYNVKISNIQYK